LNERREHERTKARKEVENQGDSSKEKENVEPDPWAVKEVIRFTDPRIVFICFGKGVSGWCVFVVLFPLLTALFLLHLLAEVIFEILSDVTGDLFEGLEGFIVPILGALVGGLVLGVPIFLGFLLFAEFMAALFRVIAGLSPLGLLVLYCCLHYLSQQKNRAESPEERESEPFVDDIPRGCWFVLIPAALAALAVMAYATYVIYGIFHGGMS
jgi:hypothetical protein